MPLTVSAVLPPSPPRGGEGVGERGGNPRGDDGLPPASEDHRSNAGCPPSPPPPLPPGGARGARTKPWLIAAIAFLFAAVAPAAEGRYGVVEIGSNGIKCFTVEIGTDFAVTGEHLDKAALGSAKPGATAFDPANYAAAERALTTMAAWLAERGVRGDRTHALASSGVFEPIAADAVATNRARLSATVRTALGCDLGFVTAADEARLTYLACVPKAGRERALLIDVGGNNTKGGFRDADGRFVPLVVNLGTKNFAAAVPKYGSAAEAREALIAKPLRQQLQAEPRFGQRAVIHLTGGLPWAVVNLVRPEQFDVTRPAVRAGDGQRLQALLAGKPARDAIVADVLTRTPPLLRPGVEPELRRVLGVYAPEALAVSAELFRAADDELGFDGKDVRFFRQGHLALGLGYLLTRVGVEQ